MEEIHDLRSRQMADLSVAIKSKQLCLPWALDWQTGCGHRTTTSVTLKWCRAALLAP